MTTLPDPATSREKLKLCLLLLAVSLLLLLPGFVSAQGDPQGAPSPLYPDNANHAIVSAGADLLTSMRNYPEQIIGRPMTFLDERPVGEVVDMRRNRDDLDVYLIVDATAFFRETTIYAVNAKDVQTVDAISVKVPMEAGMHLRGMVYYADDYLALDEPIPPARVPAIP